MSVCKHCQGLTWKCKIFMGQFSADFCLLNLLRVIISLRDNVQKVRVFIFKSFKLKFTTKKKSRILHYVFVKRTFSVDQLNSLIHY